MTPEDELTTSDVGPSEEATTPTDEPESPEAPSGEAPVEQATQETGGDENWKNRYGDLRDDHRRLQERVKELEGGRQQEQQQERQQFDRKKFEEEQQKRLDVSTYMETYKENPAQGLNEWARARDEASNRTLWGAVNPLNAQLQFTAWSIAKMMEDVAPDKWNQQKTLVSAMDKVLREMPALYQHQNYLEQAEKMARMQMQGKDLSSYKKQVEQETRQAIEQQTGKTVPVTKAPPKQTKSPEQNYLDQIAAVGKRRTKLT
jgi:hypothetical protein|tara:strand:+ start:5727 stop:6506 length:780 start_codon:yes stop_codon:yes gene_type:complete